MACFPILARVLRILPTHHQNRHYQVRYLLPTH
jgi:hypothetical protein